MSEQVWDAVIVGAGIIGAIVAKQLTEAGKKVLILEAGRPMGLDYDDYRSYEVYRSYVDYYQAQPIKIPNSPYPPNPSAPSPYATDNTETSPRTPDLNGYWVQDGRLPFMSSYLRQLGGTTLHWMGSSMRSVPSDFEMQSRYNRGQDWPVKYDELKRYYRLAEWEMDVSANREEQEFYDIEFEPGYDYPMESLPPSWLDKQVAGAVKGLKVPMGPQKIEVQVRGLPASRNSIPREFDGAKKKEDSGGEPPWSDYQPRGAVGAPHIGQRCEGNSSCTPICPVQAKYSALKTLADIKAADRDRKTKLCTIWPQTVATTVDVDDEGRVKVINYKKYDVEGGPPTAGSVRGRIFVLAAHAVENAKIVLASRKLGEKVATCSDQVGRNLMDHPYFMTWALAPQNMGSFRGPGYTSGIPSFRDGTFRKDSAAFRLDMGNWGWNFSANAPYGDVTSLLKKNVVGRELRETLGRTVPHQIRFGFQIEQLPDPGNQVTISDTYLDSMGNHRPVITYDVSDYTWQAMINAIRISGAIFDRLKIPQDQRFHLDNPGLPTYREVDGIGLAFFGAGHLAGTHRMGDNKKESVVNVNQRCHDHDNLYMVGCGSFPTIATANPTLTAAALAFKSTEDMLKRLS